MEDRFTDLEMNAYKRKVDLIIADIKLYRQNLKNSPDFNFGKAGMGEYQLDKLEQAFKDLDNFYENGKKAWFRIYKDITQNYRNAQALKGVWAKISVLYDSFWIDLTAPEKMFVSISTFKFSLPNLKGNSYSSFEEKLKSAFGEALRKADKDYRLEIESQADTYGIRVRKIALPVMYTIVCSVSKIEVTINPNARKEIKPEITGLLFNFITDFLKI